MRFLVAVVSAGAALTLIGASGLMNWVFMTSLGKSEFEQQILGAVSIAVSAFLALLPTLLLWAYRERRPLYIVLGVPVFLAFAAFSLSSAVGFAAKNRGSLSDDRALAAAKLAGVKQEIEEAETKLKALRRFQAFRCPSGIPARSRTGSPLAILEILRGRDSRCLALFLQGLFRAEGGSRSRERSRAVGSEHCGTQSAKPPARRTRRGP